MRHRYKILLALALVALVATFAHAWEHHARGPEHLRRRAAARIDAALDAVKASPAQRTLVHAAADHVFAAFEAAHGDHHAEMQEALDLFAADRLDPAAVAAHRARKEADLKKVGDALVQAIYDVHDALTAPQRQALVAHLRAEHAGHGRDHGFGEKMMKAMIKSRIDDALDEIKASEAQRAKVRAAGDQLLASFAAARPDAGAFEPLLALFTADPLDAAALASLRAEHEARFQKVADAVVAAVTEVHDTLSPEQRRQVVAWVRAHAHRG